jgi:hypothetical protein
MNDLVERCREAAERIYDRLGTKSARVLDADVCALLGETADEIERLRATLEWLDRQGGLGLEVHDRISAALSRKEDSNG